MAASAPSLASLPPELLLEVSSHLDAGSALHLASSLPLLSTFLTLPLLWKRLLRQADFKEDQLINRLVSFAGQKQKLLAHLVEALADSFPPSLAAVDRVTISCSSSSISCSSSTFFLSFQAFLILVRAGIDFFWTLTSARVELGASPLLVSALASKVANQHKPLESFSCFHLSCPSSKELENCLLLLENSERWEVDELEVWEAGERQWQTYLEKSCLGITSWIFSSIFSVLDFSRTTHGSSIDGPVGPE